MINNIGLVSARVSPREGIDVTANARVSQKREIDLLREEDEGQDRVYGVDRDHQDDAHDIALMDWPRVVAQVLYNEKDYRG